MPTSQWGGETGHFIFSIINQESVGFGFQLNLWNWLHRWRPHLPQKTVLDLQRRELTVQLWLVTLKTHEEDTYTGTRISHHGSQHLPKSWQVSAQVQGAAHPDAERRNHMVSFIKWDGNAGVHSTIWNLTFTAIWKMGLSTFIHWSSLALGVTGLRPNLPGVPGFLFWFLPVLFLSSL